MKKRAEHGTKAEKRQIKKRPRMKVHGAGLKRSTRHGGMAIVKKSEARNPKS